MFKAVYRTDNRPMALYITIKCNGSKRFRVWSEYNKPNSIYADRMINVEGERTIFFSLPITPANLLIGCANVNNLSDNDFTVSVEERSLKTYDIWLDQDTREFVDLALRFSQVCGYTLPEKRGTLYHTEDHKFNIKYFPVIRDTKGNALNTPARIGHKSGIIEAAFVAFKNYTLPARMAVLLHEFCHKYKNPKMGLEIGNEFGADINALYIYMGLGFSKIDAIHVFANVFLKAQTDENIQRLKKIQDYIARFEMGEFAKIN